MRAFVLALALAVAPVAAFAQSLTVVAPNLRVDPGPLYAGMIARLDSPVLVVENKEVKFPDALVARLVIRELGIGLVEIIDGDFPRGWALSVADEATATIQFWCLDEVR